MSGPEAAASTLAGEMTIAEAEAYAEAACDTYATACRALYEVAAMAPWAGQAEALRAAYERAEDANRALQAAWSECEDVVERLREAK